MQVRDAEVVAEQTEQTLQKRCLAGPGLETRLTT